MLRAKFDYLMRLLKVWLVDIERRQKEIVDQEARRSTIAANIAAHAGTVSIAQGRNMRHLATVSVFFLPLTYITSAFGMTKRPTEQSYWMFGVVTAAVYIPFFSLVISLNSKRGFDFWEQTSKAVAQSLAVLLWTRSRVAAMKLRTWRQAPPSKHQRDAGGDVEIGRP